MEASNAGAEKLPETMEEGTSSCDEKLHHFRTRLASDQTVLPVDLLLKVSDVAAKCPMSVNSATFEQPDLLSGEGTGSPSHRMKDKQLHEADAATETKKKKGGKKKSKGKPDRTKPNYFVAIQVTNPEIGKKLTEVQQTIVDKDGRLKDALVSLDTLHVTLMVLHLEGDDQIERAKSALEASQVKTLERIANLPVLPFEGVGHFDNQVIFAKVREGPELNHLRTIQEIVVESFAEKDLKSTEDREFKAHLTILKLFKSPQLFKQGIKKVDPGFYAEYRDAFMGLQAIESFQLCAMKKADNGYYVIEHEVFFNEGQLSEDLSKNAALSDSTVDTGKP